MPQSERSENMKEILRWLDAKTTKDGGATRDEYIHHTVLEITGYGGSERTALSYLKTLVKHGSVKEKGYKFMITKAGKDWLQRHG